MTGTNLRFGRGSRPAGTRRKPHVPARAAIWGLPLLLAALAAGCSLIESTIKLPVNAMGAVIPGSGQTEPVDPVELQEQLLRYADNFSAATVGAANKLQRDGKPIDKIDLLAIKLFLVSETLAVATGANALGNLVDMVVLTAGARIRVQDYWLPKVYGDSALPMLEALQTREKQIWALADKVLKAPQRAELSEAIAQWRKQASPASGSLSAFATVGLIAEVTRAGRRRASSMPSSVFALLDLDPLAGLDPATRELTQTRLFAERALYIGQRMPQLIEWHMELLTLRTATLPEVRQAVDNSTQLAAAGDRLSRVAEQTPALISFEREKIISALKSQQGALQGLAQQVGQTLAQGSKMAEATDQALKTFHGVVAQFDKDPSKPETQPKGEPFRIKDYAETAVEIGRMSERLTGLLNALQPNLNPETFARLSAETDAMAARTQQRGQELVDYAFWKALMFVALSAAILVAGSLLLRIVGDRLARRSAG